MIFTHDGNIADVGYKKDTTMKAILIKYNLNGDTLFTREFLNPFYPGETFIVPVDLKLTTNNQFYFTCGFDPSINGSEGDLLVLRLDSLGNTIQTNIYGNTSTEIGGSTINNNENNLIIGACKTNSNQVLKNFFRRTYIFEIDSTGTKQWEFQSLNHILQDVAYGILKSTNGGLVIGTNRGFEKPVNVDVSFLYWESAYFFKMGESQNVVWELEVFDSINPSPTQGIERMISVDNGEAYIAAGRFHVIKSIDPPVAGTFGWFIKFSDEGQLIWIRRYQILDTLGHRHRIYDLKSTSDLGIIAVGEVRGSWGNDEPQLQAWLLKLDSHGCLVPGCEAGDTVSTVGQVVRGVPELAIYPNPASDYLNFQVRGAQPTTGQARFRILDAGGREVKSFLAHDLRDTFIVPVWDWAAGVYFLHYQDEAGRGAVEKFVIVKR